MSIDSTFMSEEDMNTLMSQMDETTISNLEIIVKLKSCDEIEKMFDETENDKTKQFLFCCFMSRRGQDLILGMDSNEH